jgi:hypothetical protein
MLVAGISTTIHTIFQGEGTLLTMPNTFWIEVARAEYLHSTIVSKSEMKCLLWVESGLSRPARVGQKRSAAARRSAPKEHQ